MSKPISLRVEAPLSIGGLSKSTGIPVETLRTWERRYGFPQPERTPAGHRRYTLDTAERLKLVQRALDRSHRASAVIQCSTEQLRALLEIDNRAAAPAKPPAAKPSNPPNERRDRWLHLVGRFAGEDLERELELSWQEVGARRFVTELATDFLAEIGDRWVRQELGVAHEHFASEQLRDFLTRQWRPLADRNDGPRVVCGALAGEHHTIALHLGAVLLALEGLRPTVLGANTPAADLAAAARTFDAKAIVIAVSQAADPNSIREQLEVLRNNLPNPIPLVVGGLNGPPPEGILRLARLDDLSSWAYTMRMLNRQS